MSTYLSYPRRSLLEEWDELLKCSKKEIQELSQEWEAIFLKNKEISEGIKKEREKEEEELNKAMMKAGIEIYEYKRTSPKKVIGYKKWYKTNVIEVLHQRFPISPPGVPLARTLRKTVDGIELHNPDYGISIVQLHQNLLSILKTEEQKEKKNLDLLRASIEYATKNKIDISWLSTNAQVIEHVNEVAKNDYLKKELPDGTEVYLKHGCYECSTYYMGERRCSCGNRRISIEVEGDLLEGFHYYPEPY